MFQQNRYEFQRYTSWLKENFKIVCISSALQLVCCVFALAALFMDTYPVLLILITAVLIWIENKQEKQINYIKPLVYTDRVKRQIAVSYILLALLIFLCIRVQNAIPWIIAFVIASLLPWLLIYPMALLTLPLENAVKKWYLNDAKRILREHKTMTIIGITGSYGKTSTKNIIQSVLSEQYISLMTPASYNTPMGITRTVREMMKPVDQVFVCEMGADHVGDITELMEFVHPQIGVVTSIGPQHLSTFGTQENITREKMQMIEMLPADGCGILNYDNPFIRSWQLKNPVKTISYGIQSEDAEYRAVDIEYGPDGSTFKIVHGDESYDFETKLLGELNILNILSAVCCARYLGMSWPVIQRAVKSTHQVEHRLEIKKINGRVFIDDAFNANPTGSRMALDVLSKMPGRRIVVTPGMIELGEMQDQLNKEFGAYMKGKADEVILVGIHQVEPIYEGLKESGYDMDHVLVTNTVKEAFAHLWQTTDGHETILLENDLPDAFNH